MIRSFGETALIMDSKAKPKKITIIGTDDRSYTFLLKFDKYGGDARIE